MTRLGLMGGTFDPIHYGHLILANEALYCLSLEKVLFVTAANPPHKPGCVKTDAAHRHAMVSLAVAGNDRFETSPVEMDRAGPSYTVDTVREILDLYGGDALVHLLLGSDEARNLMAWRDPHEIRRLATIVVANRPGVTVSDALSALPNEVAAAVQPLRIPDIEISGTDLRERVHSGRSIRYMTPDSVIDYILQHGLYRGQ